MSVLILSVFLCSNVQTNVVLMKQHKARYLEKIIIMLHFPAVLVWAWSMKQNGNISLREWFSHAYWWMIIIILLILHCVIPPSGMLFLFLISAFWLETAQGFAFVCRLSFDGFVKLWQSEKLQCKNKFTVHCFCLGKKVVLLYVTLHSPKDTRPYNVLTLFRLSEGLRGLSVKELLCLVLIQCYPEMPVSKTTGPKKLTADRSALGFLNGAFGAFILDSSHRICTRQWNFDFIFFSQ